jgi:hypothetical protein
MDDFTGNILQFIEQYTGNGSISVRVQIVKDGKQRQSSVTAADLLDSLMQGHSSSWEQYGYKFLFQESAYLWHEEPLHITRGEALFLYRWLVLSQYPSAQAYFLYNMRKKYGASFLKEAEEEA